ncbi:MAG: hypothetical protein QG602_972 [Verrucomicrobiota bacterium]|nr:hypothetical protein [Verrucomicrobiota bacterium]
MKAPMKLLRPFLGLCAAAIVAVPVFASKLTITVTHDLAIARPSETISVPWREVNRVLPGAYLQKIVVKDAAGRVLPYQVTNVAPQAKDPKNEGIAYGELIFQHDFAAGEKSATFTVEKSETVSPPFPVKAFARLVPERLDDFGWENDKVAHRTYGAALAAPAPEGVVKEVLVTSGLDVWSKRVSYPIVDRWYNKGHDHYHIDEGEGMDMYQVGPSRGCGGTGVWDGKTLHVGRNFKSARVLANGPIRAIFELTYDTWAAGGIYVSETKRFIVDAGHNLDRIESTFAATGNTKELTVGIGLNKNPADRGQEPVIDVLRTEGDASLGQWVAQKSNGELGTAVIAVPGVFAGYAEDDRNLLLLAKAVPGKPLVYFAGAGWSRAGEFTGKQAWSDYIAACAARLRAPVKVTLAP